MLVKYDEWKRMCTPLLAIALLATASAAKVSPDTVTVTVDRSQLRSGAGVASLYQKIEYGAWLACESPPQPHDEFLSSSVDRACQQAAVNRTVSAINDSRLSALHETRTAGASSTHSYQGHQK